MVVRKSNFIERRPADTFVTHTLSRRARVRAPVGAAADPVVLAVLSGVTGPMLGAGRPGRVRQAGRHQKPSVLVQLGAKSQFLTS